VRSHTDDEEMPEVDLHHDIARDIGQQVERMILEAKHISEQKVGKEIGRVKAKMEQLSEKIKLVNERVARLEPGAHGMLKADLQQAIGKLEEVWEGEVGTLKHELWQTIQAHNHNADLLKHHKDAIDQVTSRTLETAPNPELEQVHTQLLQVDKIMQREQAKEQHMDQLMQRLTVVQQQLTGGLWGAGAGLAGFSGMPSQAAAAAAAAVQAQQQAAVVAAAAGKKAQRKAPAEKKASGKKAAKAAAQQPGGGAAGAAAAAAAAAQASLNASLRAEAPEFVPTQAGWAES